jgi:hypothetical protein
MFQCSTQAVIDAQRNLLYVQQLLLFLENAEGALYKNEIALDKEPV